MSVPRSDRDNGVAARNMLTDICTPRTGRSGTHFISGSGENPRNMQSDDVLAAALTTWLEPRNGSSSNAGIPRNREGEPAQAWRRSPLYHMVTTNQSMLRLRFTNPAPTDDQPDFPGFAEMRSEGMTDYVALVTCFAATGAIGEMDAIYSIWTSDFVEGFSEDDIDTLQRLVGPLAAALKCRSLARIAATLVETYLGRDAGRRVLSGRIERGGAERISAVL